MKVNKGDHFHIEAMINLKFGKAQYNAFICDDKMKGMNKKIDLDCATRLKSEDGSMIPRKKASLIQEM